MEEEILGSEAGQKPIRDKARRPWVGIVRQVARQSFAVLHLWHSPSLEDLLSQETRDLSHVDERALSSSEHHTGNVVLRENLQKAIRNRVLDDCAGSLGADTHHLSIKLSVEILAILRIKFIIYHNPDRVIFLDNLLVFERVFRDSHISVLLHTGVKLLPA
jgi:hypothetical protein